MRNARWAVPTLSLVLVLAGCQKPEAPTAGSASTEAGAAATPQAPPPAPAIVLPERTLLEVRINEALSTARNQEGDHFTGVLERPVDIGGREVVPAGAEVAGHVTTSRSSGRMKGRAALGITLDAVDVNGQRVAIQTSLDTRTSAAHKKRNLEIIGGGSGFGALIGALAGGGKGAAIGAMAGAGAGAAGAAATGRENVEIPAETVFTFRLESAVQLP